MKKNCVICNAEFEAQRADAEVCSAACRQKNWRKKQSEQSQQPSINPLPFVAPPTVIEVDKNGLQEKPKPREKDEKMERIRGMMAKINKDFGEGTIMFLGDAPLPPKEVIPTGSIGLNYALGIGGFPRGRIVEIYGGESSGKTTIALKTIAQAQKKGLKCALIDAEQAFDAGYASVLGVKVNELFFMSA